MPRAAGVRKERECWGSGRVHGYCAMHPRVPLSVKSVARLGRTVDAAPHGNAVWARSVSGSGRVRASAETGWDYKCTLGTEKG